MGSLPIIAICGRPNVGKSTLFNVLAGKRISIVDPTSGVTRDRVSIVANIEDRYYELIDTGGIGIVDNPDLTDAITYQINVELQKATHILFMVDIKDGITPLDVHVANLLRKYKEKVILVANKMDHYALEPEGENFRRLGFENPMCVSSVELHGIGELKEKLYGLLEEQTEAPSTEVEMKIAVVGKPNVGKSTFINWLAHEERVIVSEIPGTTRDSIDVMFEKDGKNFIAIDTAGLKKGKNVADNIEFYSQHRAHRSIRRADVCIFMMDATQEITRIDKEIAQYIVAEHKPVIITVNKWDLVSGVVTSKYDDYITRMLPALNYAPLSFITAKTGKNIPATLDLVRSLYKQAQNRVNTGTLNRIIEAIVAKKAPPYLYGKHGKIYYATQVGVLPPTFVLFVNEPSLFTQHYKKYLFNQFQEKLGFPEVPLRIEFREKGKRSSSRRDEEGEEGEFTEGEENLSSE